MSRAIQDEAPSVSLFPFLSVLCCVIGVLSLMILGQVVEYAIAAMTPPQPDAPADKPPAQSLEKLQRQVDALSLESMLLKPVPASLAERRTDAEARLDELGVKKADVEKAVQQAETAKGARSIRPEDKQGKPTGSVLKLVPDSSNQTAIKRPIVVECVRGKLRLHSLWKLDQAPVPGIRMDGMRYITTSAFQGLIEDIDVDKEYLLFMVRQSGIKAFDKAKKRVREFKDKKITLGIEPLPEDFHPDVPMVIDH